MSRAGEWLAAAILAGAGIVFAVGLLEVGIRFLHLVPDRFWEADPLVGVRLIAGHRGWWTQEDREFLTPVQINRQGLRDIEREYAKPPGVFRILVLGDSFVEAMHVSLDATFTRQLEERLNSVGRGLRVEVINAGVSGYGTASELLYFEREGKRYEPDLVVLAFYPGNDVKNNSPTLEDTLKAVYDDGGALQKVVGQKQRKPVRGWRAFIARSAAYRYFRQILLVRHPQLAQRLVRYRLLRREAIRAAPARNGIPVDFGVYAPALEPEWQDAWRYTERLLERLQEAVTAAGARLVVAVLCARDQIYPQWWQEIVTTYAPMQDQRWDLDGPQRRAETWCAAHDVPCAPMAAAFRAAAARGGDALHFYHDGHWTVAGHRVAAGVLQDFLEQHELVSTTLVPARQQGVRNEVH